jgi:hypothetical protein
MEYYQYNTKKRAGTAFETAGIGVRREFCSQSAWKGSSLPGELRVAKTGLHLKVSAYGNKLSNILPDI